MSADEAGETREQGEVMKSLVCHVRQLGLYPRNKEKPLSVF